MITKDEKSRLKLLEKSFGYSFKNKALLKQALTHKSYANEKKLPAHEHNERLEFLGDAVLDLTISSLLMKRHPHFSEGDLSKFRASVVNERQLATFSKSFGIGDFLYLGRGEEQTSGREKSSLLADAYEALLGAIYLDRGFEKAFDVIEKHYAELIEDAPAREFHRDYKTELQEKAQGEFRSVPRYRLVGEQGPDHDKVFEVEIYIRNDLLGRGSGRNKKEAEQKAAKEALEKLKEERVIGV